jgi:hypothetical protein
MKLPVAAAILVAALLMAGCPDSHAKEDKQLCGYVVNATCCPSWGNNCIEPALTCCDGKCSEKPFNATNPQAACGIKVPNACSFEQLTNSSARTFDTGNAFVMAVVATAAYASAYALGDSKEEIPTVSDASLALSQSCQYAYFLIWEYP